jgi:hypothetical protein
MCRSLVQRSHTERMCVTERNQARNVVAVVWQMSPRSVQQAALVWGIRPDVSLSPPLKVWSPRQERRRLHSKVHTHFSADRHTAKYPPAVLNYLAEFIHDVTCDQQEFLGLLYPEVEGITILWNDKNFLPNDTTRYFRTEWSTESLWEPQILHLCWRQQPDWHELHTFKQQDKQCTYNVRFRCVRVTICAIEKH